MSDEEIKEGGEGETPEGAPENPPESPEGEQTPG